MNIREQIEELLTKEYGWFDPKKVDKLLNLHSVSHQRELFNSFIKWIDYEFDQGEYTEEVKQHVDDYLKTIK